MHARVVRFTGVDADRIAAVKQRIEESDGPPPGVEVTSIEVMYDASAQTSVVVLRFGSEEPMRAADEIMSAMDTGDTPGSRESVDLCEVMLQREV